MPQRWLHGLEQVAWKLRKWVAGVLAGLGLRSSVSRVAKNKILVDTIVSAD